MDLRSEIRKILEEAFASEHYNERLYDRFLKQSVLTVGYEITGTRGEYTAVGTYVLSDNIKHQIIENVQLIEKYNFPKNKDYAIKIADLIIDKNLVSYFDEAYKIEAKTKTLLVMDSKTESNGNVIYGIVRSNELTTIYFAKSYVPLDAAKMRVDFIIKNIDLIKTGKVH